MSPLPVVWLLARQTLVRLLRSRMLLLLMLGMLVGTTFFLVMGSRIARNAPAGGTVFGIIGYIIYLQFVLPLTALYFGIAAVQGDLEDRTSVYLFARPLPRPALLLGKWLAAALVAAVLAIVGLCLLRLVLLQATWRHNRIPPAGMLWGFAHACGLGAMAYAALGTLFGAWLRRPLILGIVFLLGWEGAVANLAADASARAFTITDPVRRLLWDAHDPRGDYAEVLRPEFLRDPGGTDAIDPSLALLRFAGIVLALAVWIYARREYDARPAE